MSLFALYVRRDSSFVSTKFLVLNLDGWFVVPSNKFIIFDIALLYYVHLRSSIIFCLFSWDIYLSLSISSLIVFGFFCGEVFENLAVLSAILFPIKLPAVFWIAFFWRIFKCIFSRLYDQQFSVIKKFLTVYTA